jgi:hypothetical protein
MNLASHLFSFQLPSGTYVFGLGPDDKPKTSFDGRQYLLPSDNAANWWRIKDDAKYGFTSAVAAAKMSSNYIGVTSFELNNHTYIFGLHKVGANIWRMNDDGRGFKLVMGKGKMSPNYKHLVSFQLRGQPYILGLHDELGANIWRIDEGPKGLTMVLVKYKAKMAPNYKHLKVFYMDQHPYIFGLHTGERKGVGGNIWRVNDNPSQGLDLVKYGANFPEGYNHVLPVHVNGVPYLLGVVSENYLKETMDCIESPDLNPVGQLIETLVKAAGTGWVEWGKGYVCIWKIEKSPNWSIRKITPKGIPISHRYGLVTSFEQGGKAYMFGVHEEGYANIWRVNSNPADGLSLAYYGKTGQSFDGQ